MHAIGAGLYHLQSTWLRLSPTGPLSFFSDGPPVVQGREAVITLRIFVPLVFSFALFLIGDRGEPGWREVMRVLV